MNTPISRREFLKIAGIYSLVHALPQFIAVPGNPPQKTAGENILLIVFDALSAYHTSLYGYGRQTTPNLDKLADKAIVYHNHFTGGHYTPPGTASLLTGTLPWTHRVFNFNGRFDESILQKNIFQAFNRYHRMAYTHNPVANRLLRQLMPDIDDYTPWEALYLESDPVIHNLFVNDHDTATIGWKRALDRIDDGHAYSLYFSNIYRNYKNNQLDEIKNIAPNFPHGLPSYDTLAFYTLEQGIDWLSNLLGSAPQPFLGYYHFLPPHSPYNTRIDFYNRFSNDGYQPVAKPPHFLRGAIKDENLALQRRRYDEYVLYVDAEFARLYQHLESAGILENTWIVLTTDHGELFERGIMGHTTPVFYQPLAHIPLLIFPPGASGRVDIYENTSAVDVLPTLLSIAGQDIPGWAEGIVMPPFANAGPDRDITSVQVEMVDNTGQIRIGTAMIVRDNMKLVWYLGYKKIEAADDWIELFDIVADPEEITNLYPLHKDTGDQLLNILKEKLNTLSQSYQD